MGYSGFVGVCLALLGLNRLVLFPGFVIDLMALLTFTVCC